MNRQTVLLLSAAVDADVGELGTGTVTDPKPPAKGVRSVCGWTELAGLAI